MSICFTVIVAKKIDIISTKNELSICGDLL